MFTILTLLLFQVFPKFSDTNHTLFSQRENFYILKKDTLFKYEEDVWSATKHNLKLKNYKFNVIEGSENLYLIAEGGGVVLLFNNEKLEVISSSGFWESKFKSFDFIKNDTLFSYGGYGYFDTSNKLIFFDKNSKEWFDIRVNENYPSNRRQRSIGSFNNKTNELYIGLGIYEGNGFSDILKFDFKTKKWNKYADVGKHFGVDYKIITNYKVPLIIDDGQKVTFDFKNKTYNIYEDQSSAINSFLQIHYNRFTNQFFLSKQNNGFIDTHIIDEIHFFNHLKSIHSFKKDLNKQTIFLGASIALALALILIVFRLRKTPTSLMRINKNLKKIKFELDEDDLIFFEKIITSHPKAVKYQDLMSMLDNSLAYETKIKKIGTSKIRIDTVLCKYCKSKDSILQSKKNIHDSRIKEMFIKTD
ncbi:hypothetical protein N9313_04790 [Flavobacteriaceae bacterium]|nr:hypothetical protein [Flavobacteriaceae bacterium]